MPIGWFVTGVPVWIYRKAEEEARLAFEAEEKRRKQEERDRRVEAGEDPVEVDREMFGIIPESELEQQAETGAGMEMVLFYSKTNLC